MAAMSVSAEEEPADPPLALGAALRSEVWPSPFSTVVPARLAAATTGEVIDYRLWVDAGRASVGFGVHAPLSGAAPLAGGPWLRGSQSSSMIVGVRYQLNPRSRLYVDSASLTDGTAALPDRDLRMGFEFKPAPNQALGLARGTLFRVQWTSRSHLSLRLRSGGLVVALRAQYY